MRFRFLLAALALACSGGPALAQRAEPVFTPEGVRAHVEFLADDLLEGREAGERGYDLAALYVATRFRALGLKPGGTDGSWYQQVPISTTELADGKPASLSIGARSFVNGSHVFIGAGAPDNDREQRVTAPMVFVGYGLDAPELGIDDYAGADLTGKIAVMLYGSPRTTPERAAALARVDRAAAAARRGAIGVITLVSPETMKRIPWQQFGAYLQRPTTRWIEEAAAPAPNAPPAPRIAAYVDATAGKALFAGASQSLDRIFAQAARGDARFKPVALRDPVTLSRDTTSQTVRSPNVIGILEGSDPVLKHEYVLLTAHLDHLGQVAEGEDGGDTIANGAMDNAAGTAAMLEAARGFVESGVRPKRSVVFVSLTAEEEGLIGSDYLSRHPVVDGRIVADVNLDMPVLLYDFTDVVAFGAEHSTMGPIVARAAAKAGVTLSPDPMPEENLFVRSDHYSFVKAGVPSVFLVTGFANGGETAFRDFLATHYHRPSDDLSQPINWAAGAKFARINYLIAREIADGAEAPRWYQGDEYGDRFAPDAPRAPAPDLHVAPDAAPAQ